MFEMTVFEEAVHVHDRVVNSDTEESLTVDTKNTSDMMMLQILRQRVKPDEAIAAALVEQA